MKSATGLLALLLALACCAAPVIPRSYPAPAKEELWQALLARKQAVVRIQLETRATSWLGGDRVAASVPMLVERQGRLRFDPEISLQGTVATLVADNKDFALIDHRKRIVQRGPSCPDNVAAVIRIPLFPAEIAAILLGDSPLPDGAKPVAVSWDGNRGADLLEIELPKAGHRLWVGLRMRGAATAPRRTFDVVSVAGLTPAATTPWRVEFDDLEPAGAIAFPRVIRFAEPGRSFDDGVEIKIRERTVNPPARETAFTVDAPEGFSTQNVPCCRGCEAKLQ